MNKAWLLAMSLGAGVATANEPALHLALAGFDDDWLGAAAAELGEERAIKGAPYCADAVHETVQWLADAEGGPPNRIVKRQTSRLCRDGEGRTRQEVQRGGRPLVYLRDPVAREAWVLDPQRKSARRLLRLGASPAADDAAHWRDYAERMRSWAAELSRGLRAPGGAAPPVPPAPAAPAHTPAPVSAAPAVVERAGADTSTEHRNQLRVHVLRGSAHEPEASGAAMPWPPTPPAVSWRAQSLAPRGPAVVSPLPLREIEGLAARGERSSWSIEAGRIGNERAIQIVREVWTSNDLGITLQSRDFDPRSGEVSYRLQNIRRGEPDPALLRVPPDYAVPKPPREPAAQPRG